MLASCAVVAYFILIVFLHYKQLLDAVKEEAGKKKANVLDMEAMNGNVVDDTFTAIASRDVSGAAGATVMDDSGEFAVPTSATGSKNFTFPTAASGDSTVDGANSGAPLPEPVEAGFIFEHLAGDHALTSGD